MAHDVVGGGEIGLVCGLQARKPQPRQSVAGRIGINQMLHEKVGTQRPRQSQCENPDRGESNPGAIVQIAGGDQLARPIIKAVDSGGASGGTGKISGAPEIDLHGVTFGNVAVPDTWQQIEPALSKGALKHFLNEFFGCGEAVPGKNSCHDVTVSDHLVAKIW